MWPAARTGNDMKRKKLVIVGGGFAGVHMAKKLGNKGGLDVTLVDRNNYNFFPPLLYQVATGVLDVSSIAAPFRSLFKEKDNIGFRLGELVKVVPDENRIELSNGPVEYDYLVLATGTKANFFGIDNIEKHALPMKTMNDAVALRNYLLRNAERFTYTDDEDEKRKMRNIVVLGAGPSGVEVAGMLASMSKRVLRKIYPEMDRDNMNLYLVDGAPTVLPPMREKSQKHALEKLEKMGVKVKLNKMAADYKDGVVSFKDGDSIETNTLIWTAGVTAAKLEGMPDSSYAKGGRLIVDAFNKVEGTDNIFAIGDASLQTSDPDFPDGHPQLGSVATQQGKTLARNFVAMTENKPLEEFRFSDLGSMAIVGQHSAVADLNVPNVTLTGWIAWVSWLWLHLFLLVSYRNRFRTLWNWTNSLVGKARSQEIMIGENAYDPALDVNPPKG